MSDIEQIITLIKDNLLLRYFGSGAVGALLYNLTLYFKKDLGLLAEQEKLKYSKRFGLVFVICETLYSIVTGGILALYINHDHRLAFVVGFCSSVFVTFSTKTLLMKSAKKGFWIAIGKVLFEFFGHPAKKLISTVEILVNDESVKKEK